MTLVRRRGGGIALLIGIVLRPAGTLAAQTDTAAAVTQAAQAITAEALAHHLGVLADDSMGGRATPSRGLELAAQYVAQQFHQLGLTPGGDTLLGTGSTQPGARSWFQRYPVPGQLRLNLAASTLEVYLRVGGREVIDDEGGPVVATYFTLNLADAARPADTVFHWTPPDRPPGLALLAGTWSGFFAAAPRTVLVTGRHTAASVRRADLRHKTILYVPPVGADSASQAPVIAALQAFGTGLLILSDEDSAAFAQRRPPAVRPVDRYFGHPDSSRGWAVYLRTGAIRRLLAHAGLDVPRLRAETTPVIRDLPSVGRVDPAPVVDTVTTPATLALNTVGVLPGTDSVLAKQYLVFSAHLDGAGLRRGPPDRIANGADDNASGVAGLMELARAFSQPGARPRRTVVFLATSGGAQAEPWGSAVYVGTVRDYNSPTNGWPGMNLNITLDRIGRAAGDSLWVDGLQDVDLERSSPIWVAAAHPELGLTVREGGTVVTPSSDHFAFVKAAIPSVYFHTGTHAAAAARGEADSPAALDAAQEARILRLVFYVGQSLANAPSLPRWTSAGRQQRRRVFGE